RESVKGLKSGEGFIKRELFHRLKMRKCPELKFIADDSIAHSAEINKKLKEM
ncbi:MAG: ribosome-binding factor A, partial [Ruminococcus sp.]|nr:ribosome-binding factor A [Ruminococcus sp.]